MRKAFMIAPAAAAMLAGAATAQEPQEVKIGHLAGFSGPIGSLAPTANEAVRMAAEEVSDSGLFLNGSTVTVVSGDSTCTDAAAATASAEGLVNEGVAGIVGSDCSGTTVAAQTNVALSRTGLG